MHHAALPTWGIIPLVLFLLCWLTLAWLGRRVRAMAMARHPDSFAATERILRVRYGRGAGTSPLNHLRHDPVIAAEIRIIERVKILALVFWLLFMVALVLPRG